MATLVVDGGYAAKFAARKSLSGAWHAVDALIRSNFKMNNIHNDASIIKRLGGWTTIALLALAVVMFAWPHVASALRPSRLGTVGATVSAKSSHRRTVPIETLKVGDRVLAHNPEISQAERANWTEPNWNEWLQLSLTMPKADGSTLSIELLRPESWVREQMGLVVQAIVDDQPSFAIEPNPDPEASSMMLVEPNDVLFPSSPIRPFFRDLAIAGVELEISGEELQSIFVEMDLPELAITGPAVVTEIQNAPLVKLGDGRVVTATFQHSSGDVIDLVVGDEAGNSPSNIGTTSNHPFWSEDRQEYVQAGQLAIGERLQTHSGDSKRVVSKLARPGPEPVYNLEVYAEHVYYVGEDGLLVHNSGNGVYARRGDAPSDAIPRRADLNAARKFGPQHGEINNFAKHIENMGGERAQSTILGYTGHGHHVMFKKGKGAAQQALVDKGTRYLELYDIDWYRGASNLVQAPNGGGIHSTEVLRKTLARILQTHRRNLQNGLTVTQGRAVMEAELQRIGSHVKRLDFNF